MNRKMVLRLAGIWWSGFKVFCRWCAFATVLTILWMPAEVLAELVHSWAGYAVGIVYVLFVMPIVFHLTSRYLLLLGDDEPRPTNDSDDASREARHRQASPWRTHPTAAWLLLVFPIAAAIVTPPDVVAQIVVAAEMMILYGLAIFVISRFTSFKQASGPRKRAIAIITCLISVLAVSCTIFVPRMWYWRAEQSEQIPAADPKETYGE